MLVQYVNDLPKPNEITIQRLKEISNLLKCITCAVHHVIEEANEAARDCSDTRITLFWIKGVRWIFIGRDKFQTQFAFYRK